jgi:hypothetical protein
MKLYHCVGARSFRPLWALEEIGLPYEIGSASTKATRRGYSWAASRVLTKSWTSRASASEGARGGGRMKLYHCVGARSFRPLWALEEIGLPYELAMLPADDLAGRGHRQRVHEGDAARVFVGGEPRLDEVPSVPARSGRSGHWRRSGYPTSWRCCRSRRAPTPRRI